MVYKTERIKMGAISSHRDHQKMRVLILFAVVVCASAAPSGAVIGTLPAVVPAIRTLPTIQAIPAIPAISAVPISPGDIQAAAINAKVEAEDLIRAAADKNREAAELAIGNQSAQVVETTNLAQEKSQEAFWEAEDKKWQTLTALQTAQAKIEGLVASNAELLGKAVLTGVPPIYAVKSEAPAEETKEAMPEEKKEEMKENKTEEELKSDSVQIDVAKDEKLEALTKSNSIEGAIGAQTTAMQAVKGSEVLTPIVATIPYPTLLAAPIPGVPINLNGVGWPAAYIQPGVKIITPQASIVQNSLIAAVPSKTVW